MSAARGGRAGAVVTGVGTCLPETVIDNDEVSRHLDTDHAWIHSRTGIERRRRVSPGTTTGTSPSPPGPPR